MNIGHNTEVLPLWVPGNTGELSIWLDWGRGKVEGEEEERENDKGRRFGWSHFTVTL